jgi:hypothetical protein
MHLQAGIEPQRRADVHALPDAQDNEVAHVAKSCIGDVVHYREFSAGDSMSKDRT